MTLILPVAFESISETGSIVALIKPQFEAGRENVGKKGIVKDTRVHRDVIKKIINFVIEKGLYAVNLDFSPITGAQGNIEYLVEISKSGVNIDDERVEEVLSDAKNSLVGV